MLKLIGFVLLATAGYIAIYVAYTGLAEDLRGRVGYVTASVIGTLVGSTLGKKWVK